MSKEIVYKKDVLDLLSMMPPEEGITRALLTQSVKQLPSAQLEIIRCGECKWFQCNMRMDGYLPKGVDEFECRHWCGFCDPVDFCSYAERREDEQTD